MRVHIATMSGVMKRFQNELEKVSSNRESSDEMTDLEVWKSAPFPKLALVAELTLSLMVNLVVPGKNVSFYISIFIMTVLFGMFFYYI